MVEIFRGVLINFSPRRISVAGIFYKASVSIIEEKKVGEANKKEKRRKIKGFSLETLQVFACINLLVPCITLLDLSRTHYGVKSPSPVLQVGVLVIEGCRGDRGTVRELGRCRGDREMSGR